MPKTTVLNRYRNEDMIRFPGEGKVVYIGRPGPWGNPFVIGKDGDRAMVIRKYLAFLRRSPDLQERARVLLKGKVLLCYCKPAACHGDFLAMLANGEELPDAYSA